MNATSIKDYVVLEIEESGEDIVGITPMIVPATNPRAAVRLASEQSTGRKFHSSTKSLRYRTCTLDSMGNYLARVKLVREIENGR